MGRGGGGGGYFPNVILNSEHLLCGTSHGPWHIVSLKVMPKKVGIVFVSNMTHNKLGGS